MMVKVNLSGSRKKMMNKFWKQIIFDPLSEPFYLPVDGFPIANYRGWGEARNQPKKWFRCEGIGNLLGKNSPK